MSSVATWADEIRDGSTSRWHFLRVHRDDCVYEPARDCINGNCVVAAIEAQSRVLRSEASDAERLRALKFVVHLVGDVHQPFHATRPEDHGGSRTQVQAWRKGSNMHAVWDSGLIKNRVGGKEKLRQAVEAAMPSARGGGTAVDWAQESCRLVYRDGMLPQERVIDVTYSAAQDAVLIQRLAQAAKRLAELLDAALDPSKSGGR